MKLGFSALQQNEVHSPGKTHGEGQDQHQDQDYGTSSRVRKLGQLISAAIRLASVSPLQCPDGKRDGPFIWSSASKNSS